MCMITRPIAISRVLQAFSDRQTDQPTDQPTDRVHDAFPNAFKKYDETTLQFCLTRSPSGVGHAAKISRKKSNSKLINF